MIGRFFKWRWSESLSQKRWLCIVSHCRGSKKMFFCDKLPFEQINYIRTAVHLSLKCRLPNRITFDIFGRCFCKVEMRACETLRSCATRLGTSRWQLCPGASHSFNPVLLRGHQSMGLRHLSENITSDVMLKYQKWQHCYKWSRTSGEVSRSPQPNCTFVSL